MKTEDLITIFRSGLPHYKIIELVNSLQVRIEGKVFTIKESRQSDEGEINHTNIEDYNNSLDIFKGDDIDLGRVKLDWLYNENVYINADIMSDLSLMMYERYRSQFTDDKPTHLVEVIVESYDWSERSFYAVQELEKLDKFHSSEFLDKQQKSRPHANVLINMTPFATREELVKVLPMYKLAKLYPDVKKFQKKFVKNSW